MMNSIFKHGGGGSKGVMDYMLRAKDKKTPREGMTVLRGDVEIQAKLIDSLVPKFKQQYVSGCWSFEESPDQITDAQKNEIMDGTEELILAGLDPSRVSITWIEHTDKGRLELNYIVACVDLEHGRLFQPYMHSHDQARWNAFKDIQNIRHGFTDPNDPAKARTMSQTDNLPRTTKELKEDITAELENQVVQGLITNRDDVEQALNELGYTITRSSKDSISIKNPDPKGRNIKFKSTNEGGIYDINFNASAEAASEIERASADFRASASERLRAAQQVYDKELERKRDYHQKRHSRPKLEQRRATKPLNPAFAKYTACNGRYVRTIPNPYTDTLRKRNRRDSADDRELHNEHAELDRAARASSDQHNQKSNEALADMGFSRLRNFDDLERVYWGNDSEISNRLTDPNIQTRPIHKAKHVLSGDRIDEQAAIRSGAEGAASAARHDQASEANYRMERAGDSEKGQRYSSIDAIITSISSESSTRIKGVALSIHELKGFNEQNNNRISELVRSAEEASGFANKTNKRADQSRQQTNRTHESIVELSERHTELNETTERYNDVRRKIEPTDGVADSNRQLADSNRQLKRSIDEIAERNRVSSSKAEPIAIQLRELIAKQEQAKKAVPSRQAYSSPRPF